MTEFGSDLIQTILDADTTFVQLDAALTGKSLVKRLEAEGLFATVVDRAPIFSKDTLLHALYQSCQMPAYFGFNWDALEDSLNDFSWLIADAYVLIFQDFGLLKERAPEMAKAFESVANDVATSRKKAGRKPLKIVLLSSDLE